MSRAVTEGVIVEVQPSYVEDESSPGDGRYVFAYTVTIANTGPGTVTLRARHWVITDGAGEVEEVRGPGVVGAQPVLRQGQAFRYTSGCALKTPRGQMLGSYLMVREDGSTFDAQIAPFQLVASVPTMKVWN